MEEDGVGLVDRPDYSGEPEFRDLQVSDWKNIRSEETSFSHLWESEGAFQPEQFARNISPNGEWIDMWYAVAFGVNVILSIGLVCVILKDLSASVGDADIEGLRTALMTGATIGMCVSAGHFCYAASAPLLYVQWGMFISVAFSVISVFIPLFMGSMWGGVYPVIACVLSIVWYFMVQGKIPFSATMLSKAVDLIIAHPSIMAVSAGQMVIDVFMAMLYTVLAVRMSENIYAPVIWVYFAFTYYWIVYTVNYVAYMTGAGVAARDYFLKGTEFYPVQPVWDSLQMAATRSLGSAAKAGLILATIEALKQMMAMMKQQRGDGDERNNRVNVVTAILECVILCFLEIAYAMVKFMSRYGLIYCAIYGIPYNEGCRRWVELRFTKYIDVIITDNIVGTCMMFNMMVFSAGSGFLGLWIGGLMFQEQVARIITAVSSLIAALILFVLFEQPFTVMMDTWLLAFVEEPERMKATDPELYEKLVLTYEAGLSRRVSHYDPEV